MRKAAVILTGFLIAAGSLAADEIQISTTTVSRQPAEFLSKVSNAAQIPLEQLKPLNRPDLGTLEILVLSVLHKRTGADLATLLEQRKKGARLSQLIRQENQDERDVYSEAWKLRKQIDGR